MGNRITVPEKMFLGGSGHHGTSINVSMTSSKPGRIRLLEMLIGGHAVTISKQHHVNKGLSKMVMCSMVSRKRIIAKAG